MAGAAQLFVERPFFVGDGGGHDDFQLQEEISLLAGRGREPLALQAQFTVGFAAGGIFTFTGSVRVGAITSAPSAASHGQTGSVT